MASEDKVLELGENSSKRDDDSDDVKVNSELKSIRADTSLIELDSTQNLDLNSSECVIIADDTDEPAAKAMDSNDIISDVEQTTSCAGESIAEVASKIVLNAPAEISAIELADKSVTVFAEPSIESESGPCETVSAQSRKISSVAILECENADSSVTEEDNTVSENTTDTLVTEIESDVAKAAEATNFVAGASMNAKCAAVSIARPDGTDCEPSGSRSVILLDTPENSEKTAVATDEPMIDKTIEIGEDLQEEVAAEAVSELSKNVNAETHSDLDTPKKGDISIIDITTPPDKIDSNLADSEPTGDGKKCSENVRNCSVENVDFPQLDNRLENVSVVRKTDEQIGELVSTKNIESTQQKLELPIAVAAETTESESPESNIEIEENALKDVVESDLDTHRSVYFDEKAVKTHDTDVDEANERINLISPTDVSIAAESTDAIAPEKEKTNEARGIKENEREKKIFEGQLENIKAVESIGDNGGTIACEETSKTHESLIQNESEEKVGASNEIMDESMETNEVIPPSAETDPANLMDVDEECEVQNEGKNEMDFEESNEIVVAIEESKESDGNVKDTLPTSVESEAKSPDRSQFIRVKSMAFLCSDAADESNDGAQSSTDAEIDATKVDQSKAAADDSITTEKMEIDEHQSKVKTKRNRLLDNVLKNVLGSTKLSQDVQTDSDSEAPSPRTEPASPTGDAQEEPEAMATPESALTPTHKRLSQPKVTECLNIECTHKSRDFYEAPEFVISHFQVTKKNKTIYVCDECFENAITKYGELCGALEDKQPLYVEDILQRPAFVEILDSSDEEETCDGSLEKSKNVTPTVTFTPDSLAMIENELENVIASTLQRINIGEQMEWNRQILHQKLDNQMTASLAILDDLKQLQRTADRIYKHTYKGTNCFVEEVSSVDLDTNKPFHLADVSYPMAGAFKHEKDLKTTTIYYTLRKSLISAWTSCRFVEKVEVDGNKDMNKVQLLRPGKNKNAFRVVTRKHLAYGRAPNTRLDVGTRCIALFKLANGTTTNNFYPGIIAEPLREYNKWRYLVFFDDGYAQYVVHDDVRVVCEASADVWEDVVAESQQFIETYLQQFSKMRPMVQVQRGQRMMTEWRGRWINAIVNAVDASLVQMYFEDDKRYEWIYRGSTRLGPLFRQNKQLNKQKSAPKVVNLIDKADKVVDTANVSVTTEHSTSSSEAQPIQQRTFAAQAMRDTPQKQREKREQAEQQEKEKRAVAKKSSSLPPRPTVQHLNNSTIYVDEDNKPKGKVIYYTAKRHLPPRKYATHECSPSCLFQITHNLSTYSPLSKPLLSGWERQICKAKGKKSVVYKAPCGRRLRNMADLHRYLRLTDCSLNVENFDYDFMIHCLAEYVIDTWIINKPDISEGVESMVVPCVNYYDSTMPPPCVYSAKRIPTEGVNLVLDDSFMCGCDCTDDCLDKTKCACWQLTIGGAKYGNPYTPAEEIGYEFKRLPEPVPTGIYECNSKCKCKSNCLNRVAQQPLQMKLQVFKTGNRGWGLRCLNDVPKGSFICCYAGNLLTEQVANEAGENLGDEYFAELDYIEVVEGLKEGYEPEVLNDDDKSSDEEFDPDGETANKEDSDDEFVSKAYIGERRIKTRYRTRNSIDTKRNEEKKKEEKRKEEEKKKEEAQKKEEERKKRDADDSSDDERQPISFMPSQIPIQEDNTTAKSIRKFYGKNEAVYIMDAKKTGNIGRYFNHSCAPNLFVQNVFVDTHDLRFPWVAFFASSHIRAGTELTWNYNYDVGSVPGKVLYCQCGADNCRGRLL